MNDDTQAVTIPRFSFGNNWKNETCGDCQFFVEVPGQIAKLNQPVVSECRESPPVLFTMPAMNALKQPVFQIVAQYPKLDPKYPACSKWIKTHKTAN